MAKEPRDSLRRFVNFTRLWKEKITLHGKIGNTSECHSKEYYKKRMVSTNPEDPQHRKGKTYSSTSYKVRKGIEREIKKCLARRGVSYINRSNSESD